MGWFLSVTGLSKLWVYLAAAVAISGAVATVLWRTKAAGRAAERADRAIEAGRIRHDQLEAAIRAPRGPRAIADSLRDGSY